MNAIKTDISFLDIHQFENKELVNRCVKDVANKLKENPEIIVYGKKCNQRRNVGFFSDVSIGYYYSGQLAYSVAPSKNLRELLESINLKFKSDFNGILVNKYKNGNDYISAHSDNEECITDIGVVSLSYGASRKFRIRNKINKKIVTDIITKHCELIHMHGDFQKEFLHEIPIEKKIQDERYSFTFRKHSK